MWHRVEGLLVVNPGNRHAPMIDTNLTPHTISQQKMVNTAVLTPGASLLGWMNKFAALTMVQHLLLLILLLGVLAIGILPLSSGQLKNNENGTHHINNCCDVGYGHLNFGRFNNLGSISFLIFVKVNAYCEIISGGEFGMD